MVLMGLGLDMGVMVAGMRGGGEAGKEMEGMKMDESLPRAKRGEKK
jgi:hypothetical protein